MKETVAVICGKETEWLQRFAQYLQEKAQPRAKAAVFSDGGEARDFLMQNRVDLAILPEEMAEEFSALTNVFFFTEEERPGDERALYRYRPMSRQLGQIRTRLGRQTEESEAGQAEVHAVYSPVRGAGQTAAAMLLGQILAESGPTLLISTERYSVLPALLPREKEGTLADLLYYARVRGDVAEHLPETEEREGNLFWICPAPEAEDLRSASKEDWTVLVNALKAGSGFGRIVIDAGDGAQDETWLLEMADVIWMPLGKSGISLQRERAFCARLEREGRTGLLDRTRRFCFPETEELNGLLDYRQLLYTAWGRYLRQLLREGAS